MFKELLEKLHAIDPPLLLVSRIQTPDGTILESRNRHDYVTHDDANGESYMLDGGSSYQRRSVNNTPAKDVSIYTNSPYKDIRENMCRGGRGKLGNLPLKYVPYYKMSNAWLEACIAYNIQHETGDFNILYELELAYREERNIFIPDTVENEVNWSKNGF